MSTDTNKLSCIPSDQPLASDLLYQFYCLFYSVPTTILYFVVVTMIKRQSTYYSTVYVRLFSLYSYFNLLSWWTSFFISRVLGFWVMCPYWINLSSVYWLSIPYYFLTTGPIGSLVCSTIISIYQMYAIVYPTQCETVFKRRKQLIYGFIIVVPMVFCTHVLLSELRLWPLSPYRVYILLTHLHSGYDFLNTFFVNGIAGIICFVLIFISSLISLIRYWKIRSKSNSEVKLRLFAINCYICFSTLVYISYMLVQWYARAILVDYALVTAFYNYRSLLNDLCYLPIPWFVLFVNRRMRTSLGKIFGRKKITLVTTGEHLVDQEALLDVPSLIHFYKYPVEVHDLVTKDGYILQLHRIPHGRDPREAPFSNGVRPVVLLMHGLFGDSSNSVMNPPTTSPGYVLADAGFDVWLGNCRGNAYSRRHSDPDHHQNDYWNFTWYDHAHIDLPDTVDYILDYTGERSIYYVGHSQGTIIMFAKLAEDNGEFAKKIRQFFALGPVGGFASTVGLMNVLGSQTIYDIIDHILGRKLHPFELPDFSRKGLTRFCNQPVFGYFLCQSFMAMFDGLQKNSQFNSSRIALYLEHFPSSTSTLNIIHWLQLIHTHQLRKMDYGPEGNREVYGTEEPPSFNLSSITTPTYLYFSDDDKITTIDSTRHYLLEKYGPGLKGYYDLDHFTHLDFAIGLRAVDEVYRPIVRTIYEDLERRNRFRSY